MEKYYFDAEDQGHKDVKDDKVTLDILRSKISEMEILAELEVKSAYRAMVLVHKHVGTNMYLASGANNELWLRKNAVKVEEIGTVQKYHFILD